MWPWSTIRSLQDMNGALGAVLREKEHQLDLLRHDYALLQADYRALVATVGNMATRPIGGPMFEDADPWKENPKLPDVWVTPKEGEPIDYGDLLTETPGGAGAE